jgi:hypothetical protein
MAVSTSVFARQIPETTTRTVAQTAFSSDASLRGAANSGLTLVYTAHDGGDLRADGAVLYNVYNREGGGFAIVAADDVSTPLIGYSYTGSYDPNDLAPSFVAWMKAVERGISKAIAEEREPEKRISNAWRAYLSGDITPLRSETAVSPFVKTKWNQMDPYNQKCPTVGGKRPPTGCVATAMAQVMKYYNWPTQGTGNSAGYTTPSGVYVAPVYFSQTTYLWGEMTNTYTSSSSTAAKNAVSELMLHCGASVKMKYNSNESAAFSYDAMLALKNYFGYDKGMRYRDERNHSSSEWKEVLKNEIDERRPVLYSGKGEEGGHSFICDGYDSYGNFSFNWGWGGSQDGYFSLDRLNNFDDENTVVIGIQPDRSGVEQPDLVVMDDYPLEVQNTSNSRIYNVKFGIFNVGSGAFSGYLGLGVTALNSNVLLYDDRSFAIIGQTEATYEGTSQINFGYHGWAADTYYTYSIPTNIPAGTYLLRIFAISSSTNEVVFLQGADGVKYQHQITVGEAPKEEDPVSQTVGRWLFDDASKPGKAEKGPDLTLNGQGFTTIDGPDTGNRALTVKTGNYLILNNPIKANGGGNRTNRYTMLWDIRVKNLSDYNSLLQTAHENGSISSNDGDLFIGPDGRFYFALETSHSYTYGPKIEAGKWQRVVLVVDGTNVKTLIDGELSGWATISIDKNFSLGSKIYFFSDDNGERIDLDVALMALWEIALTNEEVAALGGPDQALAIRDVAVPATRVWTDGSLLRFTGFSSSATIEVFTLTGQKAITAGQSVLAELNLPGQGVYLVKVKDGNRTEGFKVVVK